MSQEIFFFLKSRRALEIMIITKKIRYIYFFCFCLKFFWCSLYFWKKQQKTQNVTAFTVIFQDPVICAIFYHFFLNQDPKTRRYGKLKQNQALELNGSLSRVFLKLYKLKKNPKTQFFDSQKEIF